MENQNKKETIRDMKELMRFEGNDVQIVKDEKGNPLFELYSIGKALGYTNKNNVGMMIYLVNETIAQTLIRAEIKTCVYNEQIYLNEIQLYNFLLEVKTEKWKTFIKWITIEVLPKIK